MSESTVTGRAIRLRGTVQGVGLRPWLVRLARAHGVVGAVRNDALGVRIEAFGPPSALERFLADIETAAPPAAKIAALEWCTLSGSPPSEFRIAASTAKSTQRVAIPADIATCAACLAELRDLANRRCAYAFTTCTDCGPRFSIVEAVPYDRKTTTMAKFRLCRACQDEYDDIGDRRFHAEANACPNCGPQLSLLDADGADIASDDPVRDAARLIRSGRIVAVKGLGGFHLACDATSSAAVARLRERKHREAKPFAVMVADMNGAERVGHLDDTMRSAASSATRPIVLVTRREGSGLAGEVAPNNPLVGLLLPYTPLHQLLLAEAERPLVMTSGNRSDEPIAYRNSDAVARLRGIADAFLMHDREIAAHCDDSVVRVIAGRPTVLRRSRGYVPCPILLKRCLARPILACGAQLKNTFCLAVEDEAYLGPHVGDLDELSAYDSFVESIRRMERLHGIRPEIVAHDLHPDYLSTRYAYSRSDVLRVGVQHHHAHVASAMAEHGLEGPVLGVAYDGGGYGSDGVSWGGELLFADYATSQRLATFRPLPLAGGEVAIRQVWRLALAALLDAFEDAVPLDELALFHTLPAHAIQTVQHMLGARLNTPLAHGVGRYFDAVGALALGLHQARYEGEVAMALELAHRGDAHEPFDFVLDQSRTPWQIDLRPAIRQTVDALRARQSAALISARFHATIVVATVAAVRAAARKERRPVVLSGGCFQNDWLTRGIMRDLSADFAVYRHERIPPGDGGIALGQALVADAIARSGG